jgi:hypothetical protein
MLNCLLKLCSPSSQGSANKRFFFICEISGIGQDLFLNALNNKLVKTFNVIYIYYIRVFLGYVSS